MRKEVSARIIEDLIELLEQRVGSYADIEKCGKAEIVDSLLVQAGHVITQGTRNVATAVIDAGIYIEKQLGSTERATCVLGTTNAFTDYGSFYAEAIASADKIAPLFKEKEMNHRVRLQPNF